MNASNVGAPNSVARFLANSTFRDNKFLILEYVKGEIVVRAAQTTLEGSINYWQPGRMLVDIENCHIMPDPNPEYTTQVGLDFVDADGVRNVSYQLVLNRAAIAIADYKDGNLVRFDESALQGRHGYWVAKFKEETKPKWTECGLCHGRGNHTEYGDTWPCGCCSGQGGSYYYKQFEQRGS